MGLSLTTLAVLFLVSLGTSAPIIAFALSAAAAMNVRVISQNIMFRAGVACGILLILSLVSSLALVILVPGDMAYWSILTFIALAAGLIASFTNMHDATTRFYRLGADANGEGASVHSINQSRRDAAN